MIQIATPDKKQKVCNNCGSHDNIQFIKVGDSDAMRSFALCKRCRSYLCKLINEKG